MASSMICGVAFLGLSATQASAADAAAPASSEVSEIVVTGTRIPTPNLTSVAPVTSVTSAAIKAQGVTRVEDLLNSLPQSFAAQGSNVSNGSDGTATVNLRVPRRLTVAVPSEPLDTFEPCAAKDCGRLLSRSSTRVTPWALMAAEVTEVTGATLVRFGVGIRVPVTTISETSDEAGAAASAADACVAERPRKATPQIIEEAIRRSRTLWIFKVYILQRSANDGGLAPQTIASPGSQVTPITLELASTVVGGQRTLQGIHARPINMSHNGHIKRWHMAAPYRKDVELFGNSMLNDRRTQV